MFGLGMGSVSASALAELSNARKDYEKYDIILSSAAAKFLWEIGVLGAFIYFLFLYFIYKDAKKLARQDNLLGRLGLGWTGVVAIAALSLLVKDFFRDGAIAYTFMYLSGLVAASAIRSEALARQNRALRREATGKLSTQTSN